MTVSRNNWLIKYWAYLAETIMQEGIPAQTSICKLFWRIVLLTPVIILVSPSLLLAAGFIVLIVWIEEKHNNGGKLNIVTEYVKARKNKVCPLIGIK